MRSLNVFSETTLVGRLYEDEERWRFEYDTSWSQRPEAFDLAPGLPRCETVHVDSDTAGPVQWFFENLLPEEALRLALEKEASINEEDSFALLRWLGAECTGSVSLFPNERALPTAHGLVPLPYEKLSSRIVNLDLATLTAGAPKRAALAGAQHKLPVVYQDGHFYEPVGATLSTHILKPNHPDRDAYPASVVNEYLTMRLAKAVGLPVPNVYMLYVPEPVYLVERFDRLQDEPGQFGARQSLGAQRKHIIDACQLLNQPRSFKYSGASIHTLNGIIEATTDKASTRLLLYRWLVFNVLMANDDCHLKNLSFFVSAEGIRLAPHYDLLSTGAYHTRSFANEKSTWPDVRMVIPLGKANFFGDVTGRLVLETGRAMGIPEVSARRICHEVATRLRVALEKEQAEIRKIQAAAPLAARVHLAAEDRLLRVIEYIIVKEMHQRLRS